MAKYVLCVLERSMYSSSVGWTYNIYLLGSHVLEVDFMFSGTRKLASTSVPYVVSQQLWAAIPTPVASLPRFSIQVCYQKTKSGYIRCVLRSVPRIQKQLPTLLQGFLHHTRSWSWNRAITTSGHTAVTCGKELWLSCFCLDSPSPQKTKMWPLVPVSSWHLCLPAAQRWWPRQVCQDLLWGWNVSTVYKKMSLFARVPSSPSQAVLVCS